MPKAQIRMFETIAVLVVFIFLFVIGVQVYFTIQRTTLEREFERARQLNVIQIAQKASHLPELDCSLAGAQEATALCFDMLKVGSLTVILASQQNQQAMTDYFQMFEYSTLNITQVYPSSRAYMLYNNPALKSKGFSRIQIPVLTYLPIDKSYGFGVLEVTVYETKK